MKKIETKQYKESVHLNVFPSVPKTPPAIKEDVGHRDHVKKKKKDSPNKKLHQVNLETDDITIQDIRD